MVTGETIQTVAKKGLTNMIVVDMLRVVAGVEAEADLPHVVAGAVVTVVDAEEQRMTGRATVINRRSSSSSISKSSRKSSSSSSSSSRR